MQPAFAAVLVGALLFVGGLPGIAADQERQADLESARNLLKAGKFAEAEKLYTQVLAQDPTNYSATFALGYFALLSKKAGIKLEEDRAGEGIGGAGKIKQVIPFMVKKLALGEAKEDNVRGLFDGPCPWESSFGFKLAGMISHQFFRPYALTFDFEGMRLFLKRAE